ncbi:MAG TPA: TolC family protein [Hyphomicrobiaceae bacterium]|nr:TolC family protein [Hyphomicrobiaceae bacterium]
MALLACPALAAAQPAAPVMERVTFDEAIARALAKNPTVAQAATAIVRAEGFLQQARAATRPTVNAGLATTVLDKGLGFDGQIVQPRTQTLMSANASVPVLAASQWAAATQARDQIDIARLSVTDVRKEIASATAQAYLGIIAAQRQIEVNLLARETAQAHLDYAQKRLAGGAGTRLNELRAAQEVAADEARLEITRLAARRAQEALGVLMAANGPVDAAAEPAFDVPPVADEPSWMAARSDLQLFAATERAAERTLRDSFKDYFPTVVVSFDPQAVAPSGLFQPSRTWRLTFSASQPIFDGGQRKGLARVREATQESSKLQLTSAQIQARSEVRMAQEEVLSAERALESIRLAAQHAQDVLSITNTAFQAGATTNLEVIDAQRSARDSQAAAAIGEDAVRRARLELLIALGRFPQ